MNKRAQKRLTSNTQEVQFQTGHELNIKFNCRAIGQGMLRKWASLIPDSTVNINYFVQWLVNPKLVSGSSWAFLLGSHKNHRETQKRDDEMKTSVSTRVGGGGGGGGVCSVPNKQQHNVLSEIHNTRVDSSENEMFCRKFTTYEQTRLFTNRKRNVILEIQNMRVDSSVSKLKTKI